MKSFAAIPVAVVALAAAVGALIYFESSRTNAVAPSSDRSLHPTTMSSLRDDPDQFHQKRIEVFAFWRFGFEEAYLYPSEKEVGHYEASVGVHIPPSLAEEAQRRNEQFITVRGRFISHGKRPPFAPPSLGRIEDVEIFESIAVGQDSIIPKPYQAPEPTAPSRRGSS